MDFQTECLTAHNDYRKQHGVPALKLDKTLSKCSEEWAKHLAAKNILEHNPSCEYGENIFFRNSTDPNFTVTGREPVDDWYEEIQLYTFESEPKPKEFKSGHFTQVVWKSSELLGVGVAKNNQGSIYVVANYSPAGNILGRFVENVPAAISAPKQAAKAK